MSEMQISPEALQNAARGIDGVIGELATLGTAGTSQAGRGFSALKINGVDAGHHGLAEQFDTFCERWTWGVRALVQDGQRIATALSLEAGVMHHLDTYVSDSLKGMTANLAGDPRMSQDEAASQSYGDLLSGANTPDYSPQSFEDAFNESKETWHNTTADPGLLDSGLNGVMMDGIHRATGDDD